jgi:hypothetical protein
MIVGVVVAASKLEIVGVIEHHRVGSIVVVAIGLVVSVLRPNVRGVALAAGVLLALVLAPPFLIGAGIALGLFVTLMTLFHAISTVLHIRQNRSSTRPYQRETSVQNKPA